MRIKLGRTARIGLIPSAAVIAALVAFPPLELLGRIRAWTAGRPDHALIAVDPPRHDFGRVKPLEMVEVDFTIENRGGRTLELEPPTASCGCQTPTIDRRSLAPGERAKLHLRQQSQATPGLFSHAVILKSNDPHSPEIIVPVTGVVSRGVVVRPEPVYMGGVKIGDRRAREIEVASDDGVPFRITHCESGGPRLTADAELEAARILHRVSLSFRGEGPLGPFEERFTVNIDRPGATPLVIPVRGEIVGSFNVAPSSLWLGDAPGFSECKATLTVSADSGTVHVDAVEFQQTGWKVESTLRAHPENPRNQPVELAIRVPNISGFLEATLSVRVSREGESAVITVPVTASARATNTREVPNPPRGEQP